MIARIWRHALPWGRGACGLGPATSLAILILSGVPAFAEEPEERFSLPPVEVTAPWPVTPPQVKEITKPAYPEPARRRGEHGTVELRLQVLPDGRVGEVSVSKSSGFRLLDEAAVAETKRWRFAPAMRGPKPTEASVEVPVKFELVD
jgi:protein TonB